jgi:serine O-acetyltransferase
VTAVFRHLRSDIRAALDRDPAARNVLEVLLCYPSIHAIFWHRVAHWLHNHKMRLLARMISQTARFFTGIEIHPGARIGSGFFIDHGLSVVTLGGTGKDTGKRHPTIGNGVLIGAGASVLGPFTVGDGARIGAGAIVLKEVAPGCTVVGNPGRVVRCNGRSPSEDLDQVRLPDPVAAEIEGLRRQLEAIRAELNELRRAASQPQQHTNEEREG